MKKTLLFCVILALLLSTTASAGVNPFYSRIDALCNLPEISVTIPATAEIFINPYCLTLDIGGQSTNAQIISSPACIENKSEVPISVTVTLDSQLQQGSDIRLMADSTKGEDFTSKCAFVYFEMHAASSPNNVSWDSGFYEEKHITVREGESRPRANMVTIAQADQPDHFGVFRLTGDCVQTPREPWTENDSLDVKIMFTFAPLVRVET